MTTESDDMQSDMSVLSDQTRGHPAYPAFVAEMTRSGSVYGEYDLREAWTWFVSGWMCRDRQHDDTSLLDETLALLEATTTPHNNITIPESVLEILVSDPDDAVVAAKPCDDGGDEASRLRSLVSTCAQCEQRPAACFGHYEGGSDSGPSAHCDQCCGHGNEDGWCLPIADLPGWAATVDLNADKIAQERDDLRAVLSDLLADADPSSPLWERAADLLEKYS